MNRVRDHEENIHGNADVPERPGRRGLRAEKVGHGVHEHRAEEETRHDSGQIVSEHLMRDGAVVAEGRDRNEGRRGHAATGELAENAMKSSVPKDMIE